LHALAILLALCRSCCLPHAAYSLCNAGCGHGRVTLLRPVRPSIGRKGATAAYGCPGRPARRLGRLRSPLARCTATATSGLAGRDRCCAECLPPYGPPPCLRWARSPNTLSSTGHPTRYAHCDRYRRIYHNATAQPNRAAQDPNSVCHPQALARTATTTATRAA